MWGLTVISGVLVFWKLMLTNLSFLDLSNFAIVLFPAIGSLVLYLMKCGNSNST